MNFLYTITAYPPSIGGAQLHAHLLAQHLGERHTIQVVSCWARDRRDWLLGTTILAPTASQHYISDGIPVHTFSLSWAEKIQMLPPVFFYYPLMAWAIPSISRHMEKGLLPYIPRTDLIHNFRIGREPWSFASLNIARRYDIPFIFTPLHHPRWVGWRYREYTRLYRIADRLIALTNSEKQVLVDMGVKEERVSVAGTGPILAPQANPQSFLKRQRIDGPLVLFLGQHYLYKGYRQLLQAADLVWQKEPDTHFVFIGPPVGRSEQIFQAVTDRRIHRLGNVSLQEKTDALAACSLLCVPSTQESFGGVYTEAWSFAKPVIGCNIPAVAEIISDGGNGFLVRQEAASIAERVLFLLQNPQRAQEMGLAGKNLVENRFTWERIAEVIERTYFGALGC